MIYEQFQERLESRLEEFSRPSQYLQVKKIYVTKIRVGDRYVVVDSKNSSVKQLNEEIRHLLVNFFTSI